MINIKEYKRRHPILFWVILVLLIVTGLILAVGVAVLIIFIIAKLKKKSVQSTQLPEPTLDPESIQQSQLDPQFIKLARDINRRAEEGKMAIKSDNNLKGARASNIIIRMQIAKPNLTSEDKNTVYLAMQNHNLIYIIYPKYVFSDRQLDKFKN